YVQKISALARETEETVHPVILAYIEAYNKERAFYLINKKDFDKGKIQSKLDEYKLKLTELTSSTENQSENQNGNQNESDEEDFIFDNAVIQKITDYEIICNFLQTILETYENDCTKWAEILQSLDFAQSKTVSNRSAEIKNILILAKEKEADALQKECSFIEDIFNLENFENDAKAKPETIFSEPNTSSDKNTSSIAEATFEGKPNFTFYIEELLSYSNLLQSSATKSYNVELENIAKKISAKNLDVEKAKKIYEDLLSKLKNENANYCEILEKCDLLYAKTENLRIEKRKAQSILDWAESIYLENIGENVSESYITPHEKLAQIEYAKKRADFSVEILSSMLEEKKFSKQASDKELETYTKADKNFYNALVIQDEINAVLEKSYSEILKAEETLINARNAIACMPAYENISDLVYIFKNSETGEWEYKLKSEVASETYTFKDLIQSNSAENIYNGFDLDDNFDKAVLNGDLITCDLSLSKYKVVKTDFSELDCSTSISEYFEIYEEIEDEITGTRIKQTQAEKDAQEFILRLWQKGNESYRNNVILAAVYIQYMTKKDLSKAELSEDEKTMLNHFKDSFSLKDIPDAHSYTPSTNYLKYCKDALRNAYYTIIKTEQGREDIAKCILFRNQATVLSQCIEEIEKNCIKEYAFGKLESRFYNVSDMHSIILFGKWCIWRGTKGNWAYAVARKSKDLRNGAITKNAEYIANVNATLTSYADA
ncbi:MAG: hypothetical protein IJR49_02015, partial [Treponema sp.]|nr:hypothetical protein [Treponema sp.]